MSQLFPRVAPTQRGYDPEQVDEFFAHARSVYESGAAPDGGDASDFDASNVRSAAFDLVRRGYRAASVDAALDRLEAAFVAAERTDYIAERGKRAWMDAVVERATALYPRLKRPVGKRFSHPDRGRGYDAAQVDALLDKLISYFDEGTPITAAEVRTASFASAPRARAYAEGPVDAYLDRVVDVLLAVE